jgi:hypothetical protein
MSERVFRQQGLGFVMDLPAYRTTFSADRIRRSSGDLHADLLVRTEWPGARVVADSDGPGVVHYSRTNVTSAATRKTVGLAIKSRVPSPEGEELDWPGLVDEFCIRVMLADRAGVDTEEVGQRPDSIVPRWAFEPFVPHGSYGLLYGPGGLGKSILALLLCVSVAQGRELVEGFAPSIKGPVLYLDWEATADELDRRIKAVCRGLGTEPPAIRYRRGAGRTLADQVEAIARQVATMGAVFIVVDSATKAIGTSGEGPIEDAANRFASALDAIGASALVIDHIPKPKPGERRPRGAGPIGSVMKTNWARASWELREARPKEDDEDTVHLALFHDKTNTTYRRRPIGLAMTWNDETGITWEREDITDETLTENFSLRERIERLLARHPMTPKEIAEEIGEPANKVRSELSRGKGFVNLGVKGWALAAGGES